MLEDLSLRIFQLLDRELSKEGILLVEQLPSLISKLEAAIAQDANDRLGQSEEKLKTDRQGQSEEKLKIDRLGQRSYPFLELLKSSLKHNNPIVWGH